MAPGIIPEECNTRNAKEKGSPRHRTEGLRASIKEITTSLLYHEGGFKAEEGRLAVSALSIRSGLVRTLFGLPILDEKFSLALRAYSPRPEDVV